VAKVLIVDDDADVRGLVRRVLTKLGHEVTDVDDGSQALRLLESTAFDVVVTDVYMATVDGMELLVRIQQRGLSVPVVAISGGGYKSRDEVLQMAAASGAVATLDKPFTPDQLRETIERILTPRPAAEP
jgi:CheY-like chemotaxis protein